jgi:hypothetical protein
MIGMRMTVETEQLLQEGGAPASEYHNRTVGFLGEKGMAAKDVQKEMLPMYGEHRLLYQAVHNWEGE